MNNELSSEAAVFMKQTLKHYGHSSEDIDAVLIKHGDRIRLEVALQELQDLKNHRRRMPEFYNDFIAPTKPSNTMDTIIISSDSDTSDFEIITTDKQPKPRRVVAIPTQNSEASNTALECAMLDLPSLEDIKHWLKINFRVVDYEFVSSNDLFVDFCKHFSRPEYPELKEVFIRELSLEIFQKCHEYKDINSTGDKDDCKFWGICKRSKMPKKYEVFSTQCRDANSTKETSEVKEKPTTSKIEKSNEPCALSRVSPLVPLISKQTFSDASTTAKEQPTNKPNAVSSKQTISNEIQNLFKPISNAPTTSNSPKVKPAPRPSAKPNQANTTSSNYFLKRPAMSKERSPTRPFKRLEATKVEKHNNRPLKQISNELLHSSTNRPSQIYYTKEILNLSTYEGNPGLRPIIIDGSNVACSHGNSRTYSCRGIALCVRFFWDRGHRDITCFVPNFRKGPSGHPPITDQEVLFILEDKGICKFTPSRKVNGKNKICYDDRYIIRLAEINEGIIVSNDQFRDLKSESSSWKHVIETRLLMFVFVQDHFMPPDDPLGSGGPRLADFLSFPVKSQQHGYHKSTLSHKTDTSKAENMLDSRLSSQSRDKGLKHTRDAVAAELLVLFPGMREKIQKIMHLHPRILEIEVLADLLFDDEL